MNKELERGLYRSEFEKDACGIGLIAHIKGESSHGLVKNALNMLENMEHRGGCGCEPETGDGAGIMLKIDHDFFSGIAATLGFSLPDRGAYAVATIFYPKDDRKKKIIAKKFEKIASDLSLEIIGTRGVPTNNKYAGATAIANEPFTEHVFLKHTDDSIVGKDLDRKLYVLRKYSQHTLSKEAQLLGEDFYIVSMSTETIVYKGQLRTDQLRFYYPDLINTNLKSCLALTHSRFSTNTFPRWRLAQPFHYLAHNGEINTIKGNVNKMKSKEALLSSKYFTQKEIEMILPVCDHENSDSSNLDEIVELLVLSGRTLPQVMMMLVPEAWQDNKSMDEEKKAFYKFHASLMEPWDGPAALCFTDGNLIGATLDRNGLRPCRYTLTSDDYLIMASETGTIQVDQSKVVAKGRLQPGKMFLADLSEGRIITDEEIKTTLAKAQPYGDWIKQCRTKLRLMPTPSNVPDPVVGDELLFRQRVHGYTREDLRFMLEPMASMAKDPIGSMGSDTPLAVLSSLPQHPSNYFKQMFAQVSNPPIDPIRERMVMSLFTRVGKGLNILEESPEHSRQVHITQPVLKDTMFEKIKHLDKEHYKYMILSTAFDPKKGLKAGIASLCEKAETAVKDGFNILILSDRDLGSNLVPIPSLLSTGAVHHHLVKNKLRSISSIVVEAGDVIETQHFATLIGYGASAVYPYVAFDTIRVLNSDGQFGEDQKEGRLIQNYIKAVGDGLLKIMSKMGISTLQSYQGAQIFEAVGIDVEVIEKCFTGTTSRIAGVGFDLLEKDALKKHEIAHSLANKSNKNLEIGGFYQWKRQGEVHLYNPETIHLLQKSTRSNDYNLFKKYSALLNKESERAITLRSLLDFKEGKSIPIEEVEPIENIFKRFATGAMSFGSISWEAHTTLAIAMNRIGGKSNSGEGGEDPIRYEPNENGDFMRSAIKQVASGRFGVSSYYLTNANEIQIKIAQGAKPGEGGQLPGHKVDDWIGRTRNSTPGVGLISPPPHHDIYSIEDLAQLIYDLKNANREARINVKLVSEAGVGTIAAGVAKAFADVILIAGGDGGTGASPWSSIRHAGLPWELGLSEAHQTLVKNGLRSRVVLQADGKMLTGRDLAIAALLGAEEWGVSTAALVVGGCIMMRKCHLNTCPVGVATQDPELRKLFTGDPDHIVNLFTFLATELREIMASLGFRTMDEMVGQVNMLKVREGISSEKIKSVNLDSIIYQEPAREGDTVYNSITQKHRINDVLDRRLIKTAEGAIESGKEVSGTFKIVNTDRSVGAMLSNEISKKYKGEGLPQGTIKFTFKGSAGQSFGAFGANGLKFTLEGAANDYFGKGLSGAQLVVYPDIKATFDPKENMIIGNVALYGAIDGEVYVNGMAGERFCVRNSGAHAVVEGVGDHGCEYMTGGRVIILGPTGRNFAAGMSGGIGYIYDQFNELANNCNMEMVEFDELDLSDMDYIKKMVTNHMKFTGSKVAEEILTDWGIKVKSFVKVMPVEYKAILMKNQKKKKKQLA